MRLYLAGPLFTQAERAWNLRLAAVLTEAGHDVFLPQVEIQTLEVPAADDIFRIDVDGVRVADALVAILDGADADSGTSFECGLAYALGIPIVAVRTDFRGGGDDLPGQALPTINLMLAQAVADAVHLPGPSVAFEVIANAVLEVLSRLSGPGAPLQRLTTPSEGAGP
jgi:nucleoside 2-deoxyribosyltransferase